jgi:DNA sulfur modification protein DndD
MNISAIHLNNFKSFKGYHKIEGLDENLSPEKNIILIGGLNGAGKTTIIEALTLCFYGNGAKHLYPTKGAKNENYNAYVVSLLNNDIRNLRMMKEEELSVEVYLSDVNLAGNVHRSISLKRCWKINTFRNVITDESFDILENGEKITDIEQSEYDEVINNILPYNISQFFFFDGEKIQDFASDPEVEFTKSLNDVLGISLYSQLNEDIKTVRGRIIAESNRNRDVSTRKKEKEADLAREIDKVSENHIKIKQLKDEISEINVKREKLSIDTRRLTGISAESRQEFTSKKSELQKEQELLEQDYLTQSKDYLPFILSQKLCKELESQLKEEEEVLRRQAAEEAIKPRILGIIERIFDNNPPPPTPMSQEQELFYRQKIESALRLELSKIGQTNNIDTNQLIHRLSSSDVHKLRNELSKIKAEVITPLQKKNDTSQRN